MKPQAAQSFIKCCFDAQEHAFQSRVDSILAAPEFVSRLVHNITQGARVYTAGDAGDSVRGQPLVTGLSEVVSGGAAGQKSKRRHQGGGGGAAAASAVPSVVVQGESEPTHHVATRLLPGAGTVGAWLDLGEYMGASTMFLVASIALDDASVDVEASVQCRVRVVSGEQPPASLTASSGVEAAAYTVASVLPGKGHKWRIAADVSGARYVALELHAPARAAEGCTVVWLQPRLVVGQVGGYGAGGSGGSVGTSGDCVLAVFSSPAYEVVQRQRLSSGHLGRTVPVVVGTLATALAGGVQGRMRVRVWDDAKGVTSEYDVPPECTVDVKGTYKLRGAQQQLQQMLNRAVATLHYDMARALAALAAGTLLYTSRLHHEELGLSSTKVAHRIAGKDLAALVWRTLPMVTANRLGFWVRERGVARRLSMGFEFASTPQDVRKALPDPNSSSKNAWVAQAMAALFAVWRQQVWQLRLSEEATPRHEDDHTRLRVLLREANAALCAVSRATSPDGHLHSTTLRLLFQNAQVAMREALRLGDAATGGAMNAAAAGPQDAEGEAAAGAGGAKISASGAVAYSSMVPLVPGGLSVEEALPTGAQHGLCLVVIKSPPRESVLALHGGHGVFQLASNSAPIIRIPPGVQSSYVYLFAAATPVAVNLTSCRCTPCTVFPPQFDFHYQGGQERRCQHP